MWRNVFNFAFLSIRWFVVTNRESYRATGANQLPDITRVCPDRGAVVRERVFPRVCKAADQQVAVAFSRCLSATSRESNEVISRILYSSAGVDRRAACKNETEDPLVPRCPSRCIAEDFLTTPVSGLRRAKSSRERAEGGRERPKRRGRARATMWRRHDDRSAVSVTATVVRRGCAADFQIGIRRWDSRSFFFFFLLFLLLFIAPDSTVTPIEFTARSTTVATFPRTCSRVTSRRLSETHAYETCHASFLWKETRSVQVRPHWDRPRFHEQARGRSSSSPFWGESKIIPILGYCKKSGALRTSLHATDFVLNYALSSALIMNLFDAVPLILTAAFDRGEFNSRPFVIRL